MNVLYRLCARPCSSDPPRAKTRSALRGLVSVRVLDGADDHRRSRTRSVGCTTSGPERARATEFRSDHRSDRSCCVACLDSIAAEARTGNHQQCGGDRGSSRPVDSMAPDIRRDRRPSGHDGDRHRRQCVRDGPVHRRRNGPRSTRRPDDRIGRTNGALGSPRPDVYRADRRRNRLDARRNRRYRNRAVRLGDRATRSTVHALPAVAAQYEDRRTSKGDGRSGGQRRRIGGNPGGGGGVEHGNESACGPGRTGQFDVGRSARMHDQQ